MPSVWAPVVERVAVSQTCLAAAPESLRPPAAWPAKEAAVLLRAVR